MRIADFGMGIGEVPLQVAVLRNGGRNVLGELEGSLIVIECLSNVALGHEHVA